MQTLSPSSAARWALILAIGTQACSNGSSPTGGNTGGSASSSGGQTTAASAGSSGPTSSGGRGSGGVATSGVTSSSGGQTTATSGSSSSSAPAGGRGSGGAVTSGGNAGSGGAASGGATTADSTPSDTGGTDAGGNGGRASGGTSRTGGTSGRGGNSGTEGTTSSGGAGVGGTTGAGGTSGTTPGGPALPSAGCGKTSTLTFGTVPGESGTKVGTGKGGYVTIQSGGQNRGFAMRLPDNYDNNKPYWLIFGFHWNGGSAAEVDSGGTNGYWWAYYGMQRKSKNNAIFVAPDGLGAGWANSGGRDLTFTDDMVKLIQDNYCVDTKNIITMGFSYGGGMSYALACARAKVFRAAVIYAGGQLSGCEGGNDPVALWQMQGLTDGTIGMGMATPIRDRFVKNNGCTPQSPPQPPNPGTWLNPGGHICTDYAGCSAGHPVRWCVTQSGHGPGAVDGTSDLYNSCATPPKTCSTSCPCTWTPDDVWPWLNGETIVGQTPNATK